MDQYRVIQKREVLVRAESEVGAMLLGDRVFNDMLTNDEEDKTRVISDSRITELSSQLTSR